MKKILAAIIAVAIVTAIVACVSDPGVGPELTVQIPELFSIDLDNPQKLAVNIDVKHPAPVKEWVIQVNRQRAGDGAQRQAGEGGQRQAREGQEARQPREGQDGEQRQPRQRAAFYEETGKGKLPKTWQWDGKGTNGEMVQSVTDYRFDLIVTDKFDNKTTYDGVISVDVIFRREGDSLRIVVPSIVFPGGSADLNSPAISDEDRASNRRVIRLISRALNRFEDYEITVEGHANQTEANPSEQEKAADRTLSEARAKSVIVALSSGDNTTRADRMTAVGVGIDRPAANWEDEEESWKNRRVEFLLHK